MGKTTGGLRNTARSLAFVMSVIVVGTTDSRLSSPRGDWTFRACMVLAVAYVTSRIVLRNYNVPFVTIFDRKYEGILILMLRLQREKNQKLNRDFNFDSVIRKKIKILNAVIIYLIGTYIKVRIKLFNCIFNSIDFLNLEVQSTTLKESYI